ncbi:MAG TPA: ferrous iron transport protein B [Candidatus Cloacimonadota bacterium]|nr:ferrous iron transport protein B [Candidatus Cloacimonadota bacterium]
MKNIKIALAGNPNSGKTTIFNNLTGSRQHVGNYPGVTVEKKEGKSLHKGQTIDVIDLPGTYSLTAYSIEEKVARQVIIEEKPDYIVNIVDISNLERNLYLTIQLKELGVPLIIVFNMWDIAQSKGMEINIPLFSKLIQAPIVKMVGFKNKGTEELLDLILSPDVNTFNSYPLTMDTKLESYITDIQTVLGNKNTFTRWQAIKLLEGDTDVRESIKNQEILNKTDKIIDSLNKKIDDGSETLVAEQRYGLISGICHQCVRSSIESRVSISDRIDSIVTHKVIGIPLFLGLMYLVFQLTFTLGDPLMGWIESFFEFLSGSIDKFIFSGQESILRSLVLDGIIGGVGGVLVFLPNILLLFLALSVLEDTGYMARASFIMDKMMNKIGLHGKSFIPMIIGFGCTVPAIMATRTLESKRDRLATILVTPLVSCSARMPIYALIIPAFFPKSLNAPILWAIYMIGILLAIVLAKILRSTVFKGEAVPFVMELPPYRIPTLKSIFIHMWDRGGLYLKKAGTIILGISILLWFLTTFPQKQILDKDYELLKEQIKTEFAQSGNTDESVLEESISELENQQQSERMAYTVAGRIGHAIEPVLKPMGFDWKIGTALIGAFAAKEVFVAQMGIVFSLGEADEESDALRQQLRSQYNPLIAFCIMLFCLISAPCMATIAVTKRETNSWKWALIQLGGLTLLAWLITTFVYQAGVLLNIGLI